MVKNNFAIDTPLGKPYFAIDTPLGKTPPHTQLFGKVPSCLCRGAVFGSFKHVYRKSIKSGERNKTQQKKMNQRRATTGAMSDERRAVPSSIDERACQTRTAHRSRRLSARCDRPTSAAIDDRCSPIWALSSLTLSLIWALSSL